MQRFISIVSTLLVAALSSSCARLADAKAAKLLNPALFEIIGLKLVLEIEE